jgi:hypothetical protein
MRCGLRPVLFQGSLPDLPVAESLPDGRVVLSHAPGRCPLSCMEPEMCSITKQVRWWEMKDTITEIFSSPTRPCKSNTPHCSSASTIATWQV